MNNNNNILKPNESYIKNAIKDRVITWVQNKHLNREELRTICKEFNTYNELSTDSELETIIIRDLTGVVTLVYLVAATQVRNVDINEFINDVSDTFLNDLNTHFPNKL